MANLKTKYLDYDGLSIFLSKLQEYIADKYLPLTGGTLSGPMVWENESTKNDVTIDSDGITIGSDVTIDSDGIKANNFIGDLQGNADTSTTSTTSGDSEKLGGKLPSYYAKKEELTSTNENIQSIQDSYNSHKHSVTAEGSVDSAFTGIEKTHDHTFTGDQDTSSSEGLTISYSKGKLSITSAHTHTLTPTGTISDESLTPTGTVVSTFTGKAVSTDKPS